MKKIIALALLTVSCSTLAESNYDVYRAFLVKQDLKASKTCTVGWSRKSSQYGKITEVHDARKMNGKVQYLVDHDSSRNPVWVWAMRLNTIVCR